MARFGIRPKVELYCISTPNIRKLGKEIGTDHDLSLKLWKHKIHDARFLAALIADPEKAKKSDILRWIEDFDSWAICDSVCFSYIDKTRFAWDLIPELARRDEEYIKRTAFTLMASLAVHDKKAGDQKFIKLFPLIKIGAKDERNFVKKAVNWAIRQIGKRNQNLNKKATLLSEDILKIGSPAARWIASGALCELKSPEVLRRLKKKSG